MKLREFEQHPRKHNCVFAKEGARHTAYINSTNRKIAAVPRHKELKKRLVRAVCKALEIPDPFSE